MDLWLNFVILFGPEKERCIATGRYAPQRLLTSRSECERKRKKERHTVEPRTQVAIHPPRRHRTRKRGPDPASLLAISYFTPLNRQHYARARFSTSRSDFHV